MSTLQCKPKTSIGHRCIKGHGGHLHAPKLEVRSLPYHGGLLQIGHLTACWLSLGGQEGRSPTAASEHASGAGRPHGQPADAMVTVISPTLSTSFPCLATIRMAYRFSLDNPEPLGKEGVVMHHPYLLEPHVKALLEERERRSEQERLAALFTRSRRQHLSAKRPRWLIRVLHLCKSRSHDEIPTSLRSK
jgi:hypothetical protein